MLYTVLGIFIFKRHEASITITHSNNIIVPGVLSVILFKKRDMGVDCDIKRRESSCRHELR
ncbi:hypothetical protein QTP88_020196 [Uroleucon formosanum]